MEAFAIDGLSFAYPGAAAQALDGVSLTVRTGEFLVLCGASGSGKTTLLRLLKPALAPHGAKSGTISFFGEPVDAADFRRQSAEIGFVRQSPEDQLVADRVWHELAFGLENLGCDTPTIRRRVAETAAFFGIEPWFRKNVNELSGGQKQLLALASVMVLRPRVLLLDEPTAQLDPIAASEFLHTLARVRRELGVTVVLSEHRLEEAAALCDRVAVLERGKLVCVGTPRETGAALKAQSSATFLSMPAAMRLWAGVESGEPCPLTVPEGQAFLADYAASHALRSLPPERRPEAGEQALCASELWFRYERDSEDVLRGIELHLCKGEILAVLGGNGAGKSTALRLLAGLLTPLRGSVTRAGRAAYLPQDPQLLFTEKTVGAELSGSETERSSVIALCGLAGLLDRHPYDLSGGEQQRLAIAKLLLGEPDILLLDEPTKGMDAAFKRQLTGILRTLCAKGAAIVLVSHDVEFCAQIADRCALLFDGAIMAEGTPRMFFSGNRYYTTAASRIAADTLRGAVTVEELVEACGGTLPRAVPPDVPAPPKGIKQAGAAAPDAPRKRALPRRTRLAVALDLLLIPLTIFLGGRLWGNERYYFISLLAALEAMAPFFFAFEGRRPRARELVTIASLCAIGVVGRAAFFMLQQFKPVIALVTVAGVAFGGETGFLVGAMTMLLSNLFFGQGPWTPFQMLAMGLIGLLGGVLHASGLLPGRRVPLCAYGAIAAIVVYGGIVNPAAALLSTPALTVEALSAYYAAGLPLDLVQAGATVVFLWFAGEPMLEKLERMKMKYGILQN